MSRIGKQPVAVPDGVEVSIEPKLVSVKEPEGELSERKNREIGVKQEDGQILVERPTDRGELCLHGLTRSLIANMVEGVTNGFEKRLEIKASATARSSRAGSSCWRSAIRTRSRSTPEGIEFEVPAPHAHRRAHHREAGRGRGGRQHPQAAPAGALQGQGIRYEGEYVARKVGKRA